MNFPYHESLTMSLNSMRDSLQKWPKSIHSTPKNRRLAEHLLMNIWSLERLFCPSPHKYYHSSLHQKEKISKAMPGLPVSKLPYYQECLPATTHLWSNWQVQGSLIFTKMDIQWGYNNILIKPEDRWKAAFITLLELYKPTVMFFGLCNSPAMFQALMNHIFGDLMAKGWLIVYMDDTLIHSNHQELHTKPCQSIQTWLAL